MTHRPQAASPLTETRSVTDRDQPRCCFNEGVCRRMSSGDKGPRNPRRSTRNCSANRKERCRDRARQRRISPVAWPRTTFRKDLRSDVSRPSWTLSTDLTTLIITGFGTNVDIPVNQHSKPQWDRMRPVPSAIGESRTPGTTKPPDVREAPCALSGPRYKSSGGKAPIRKERQRRQSVTRACHKVLASGSTCTNEVPDQRLKQGSAPREGHVDSGRWWQHAVSGT